MKALWKLDYQNPYYLHGFLFLLELDNNHRHEQMQQFKRDLLDLAIDAFFLYDMLKSYRYRL